MYVTGGTTCARPAPGVNTANYGYAVCIILYGCGSLAENVFGCMHISRPAVAKRCCLSANIMALPNPFQNTFNAPP